MNLSYALKPQYPNANREWIGLYVFPSGSIIKDLRNGLMYGTSLIISKPGFLCENPYLCLVTCLVRKPNTRSTGNADASVFAIADDDDVGLIATHIQVSRVPAIKPGHAADF